MKFIWLPFTALRLLGDQFSYTYITYCGSVFLHLFPGLSSYFVRQVLCLHLQRSSMNAFGELVKIQVLKILVVICHRDWSCIPQYLGETLVGLES